MVVGFTVSAFWLLLVKSAEAKAIGLVQTLTGGKTRSWPTRRTGPSSIPS